MGIFASDLPLSMGKGRGKGMQQQQYGMTKERGVRSFIALCLQYVSIISIKQNKVPMAIK